jgi:hypothetical protein
MPWTTPRTWVKGDFPTVGRLNTDLRDNMLFVATCFGGRVRASTNFSIPGGSQVNDNAWDTEDWDSDDVHNTTLQNRLIINTAGKYFVGATIPWASTGGASGNQKRAHLLHNRAPAVITEVARVQERGIAGESNILTIETIYDCLPGDYFQIEVFQDTGGAVNTIPAAGGHIFFVYRISN